MSSSETGTGRRWTHGRNVVPFAHFYLTGGSTRPSRPPSPKWPVCLPFRLWYLDFVRFLEHAPANSLFAMLVWDLHSFYRQFDRFAIPHLLLFRRDRRDDVLSRFL